jgi:uncharacterized protein YbjT (DUF2867 family)
MTQVTIFGGTGFIGRYVVDKLADLGVTIKVATRHPQSVYFLRTAGSVGQVVPVVCDIHNDASVAHAVAGSDWIINLVGVLTEKGKNNFDNVHAEFPARLAKAARAANASRFIQISALGADKNAKSHYACSKAQGEANVLAEFPNATILRPSIVFGPEDSFFNRFARMASIAPFLPLIGGGKTMFQPVYVGDVVTAIMNCLTSNKDVQGKIFELAGPEQLSFKDCLQRMMDITQLPRHLVPVPFAVAKMKGAVLQCLPGQVLTLDQVRSLQSDNIISNANPTLKDLGVTMTPLDAILPSYLKRYRAGGKFAARRKS